MDRVTLIEWATKVADGHLIDASSDRRLSLSSELIRFRWRGVPSIAVGSDAAAKTRIDAVLDGVASLLHPSTPDDGGFNLILGVPSPAPTAEHPLREHIEAIGTLLAEKRGGPDIGVWQIGPGGEPEVVDTAAARFDDTIPTRWLGLLDRVEALPVAGVAAALMAAVGDQAAMLYPKLSGSTGIEPWQVRLDGLEVGRAGEHSATLALATQDLSRPREPRTGWRKVVGTAPITVTNDSVPRAAALLRDLIQRWRSGPTAVASLAHGHAEHALEARVLSGRLAVRVGDQALRPLLDRTGHVARGAQFPTLWGNVTRPTRYLDALLVDASGRPWAIELKDQATGGNGGYLRHGIGQAVLYRHFIRSAEALDPWFARHGMTRAECRAALAFPEASAQARSTIAQHRLLAAHFGIEVIELPVGGA